MKSLFNALKAVRIITGLFLLLLINQSCKKEPGNSLDENRNPEQYKKIESYLKAPRISIITFEQFNKKIDYATLGSLKMAFQNPKFTAGKLMSVNTEETYKGFALLTDTIKMIIAKGHTSYVFRVKPSSPHALTFQNLTIDVDSTKTLAFINTYTPSKKWVSAYKKGKNEKFDGTISVTYLETNGELPLDMSRKSGSTAAKLAVADGNNNSCTTTTYYFEVAYNCSSGRHGPGDSGCYMTGNERAGYRTESFQITTCDGEGGDGGGGTSPTPPNSYDPCNGGGSGGSGGGNNPPPEGSVAQVKNGAIGTKLMVADNGGCGTPEPPKDPEPPQREITVDVNARKCVGDIAKLIIDNANLKDVIKELKSLANYDARAAISTLDNSTTFKLIIGEQTIPDRTLADGSIERKNGITDHITGDIAINKLMLDEATDLGAASTIIHEMMHAYFVYGMNNTSGQEHQFFVQSNTFLYDTTGKFSGLAEAHHAQMATSYVNSMAGLLQSIAKSKGINSSPDGSISLLDYCKDLFWNNLSGSQSAKKAPNEGRAKNNGQRELKNYSNSSGKKGC